MKKLNYLLLFLALNIQCQEYINPLSVIKEWQQFSILPEGYQCSNCWRTPNGHHATPEYITQIRSNEIVFWFEFPDSTCVYEIGENQSDWNKLFGVVDYWNKIHDYSFRYGWRYHKGSLQIGSYVHLGDDLLKSYICSVKLKEINYCIIEISEGIATFNIYTHCGDTYSHSIMDDRIHSVNIWYVLYPYFGGNCTVPHKININLKCEQLITALDN